MACEKHQEALKESAASGAELAQRLRIHLLQCSACERVYTEAKLLFAEIDREIVTRVNEHPSANYVSQLRTSVFTEGAADPSWFDSFSWRSLILSTATIVIIVSALAVHKSRKPEILPQAVMDQPRQRASLNSKSVPVQNSIQTMDRKQRQQLVRPIFVAQRTPEEVIFSAEEREGYQTLVSALQQRTIRSIVVPLTPLVSQNTPLEFKPVQIASLKIDPLVRGAD